MKVVWVARTLPAPANAGDRLYSLGLAGSLAAAGAEVRFLGLADAAAEAADFDVLPKSVAWIDIPGAPHGRLRTLFSRLPLEGKRFAIPAYARLLKAELDRGDVDVVVLDHYSSAWALPLLAGRRVQVATIAHNYETGLSRKIADDYRGSMPMRLALRLNAGRTRRAETALVSAAGRVITITKTDACALSALGARRTLVLSPGYDGARINPEAPLPGGRRVVLLGSYTWVAKQMNLRAFLHAADERFAACGVALDIVGALPADLRAELEPGLKATRLLGFVEDAQPILRAARIGVVPEVTGGGFKLKMLDYIFSGLVVAGIASALEGLPERLARHTLRWDDLNALAEGVCNVISDDENLGLLRRHALEEAADAYAWKTRGEALFDALSDAA